MPRCSVCGSQTSLLLKGVQICPTCADAVRGKVARSFAEVSEALTLAREALVGHPGDPDGTEAIRKANARVVAASLEYVKALREYRAFFRHGLSRVARRAVEGKSGWCSGRSPKCGTVSTITARPDMLALTPPFDALR
jgi:hypothetical protein